jgi:hypothetical protein
MARERAEQPSPDLFSTKTVGDVSPKTKRVATGETSVATGETSNVTRERPLQRHVLPKDLPNAVKQLSDGELDLLYTATLKELGRRGKSLPNVGTSSTLSPADLPPKPPPATKKHSHGRQVKVAPISLTRGLVNVVRAAFKAGVTPSRIARQFGLTQSDVRKALASDEAKR